jgi:acetyl esterase/lipase
MTQTWGPPPTFDVECDALLQAMPAMPRLSDEVMVLARQVPQPSLADLELGGAFTVEQADADGVPVVIARPTGRPGPVPVLYLLHHGGMVLGSPTEGALPVLLKLALPLGLAVVAAGYRLAPAVRAPELTEDCYRGLVWLQEQASALGFDEDRIVLMGVSGGGGLAAACSLLARDRGRPQVRGQLLMYPMLDDRNNSGSAHQMADVGIWRQQDNAYAWRQVLGDEPGTVSEFAAPARATDLSGLPPTYLDAGSAETFRDEIVDFAQRIWLAGGSADLHVWDGGFHGFDLVAPESALGRASWQTKIDWLRHIGCVTSGP